MDENTFWHETKQQNNKKNKKQNNTEMNIGMKAQKEWRNRNCRLEEERLQKETDGRGRERAVAFFFDGLLWVACLLSRHIDKWDLHSNISNDYSYKNE